MSAKKPPPEPPKGTIRLTKLSVALLAAVVAFVVIWVVLMLIELSGGSLPYVPWPVPVVFGVLAALVGVGAWISAKAVAKGELEAKDAVLRLAAAKTATLGGSIIAGGYLAVAFFSLPRLAASLPQSRFWMGLVTAITALALAGAGYALELALRVPPDDENENGAPA
ncbi:MAG: DUF3180 family protein [Propionibacteriaceae bacterium]|jgi:hypothetical protein|nr:DUF3180 family protein [Propionibacteriaceae bacterium]